MFRCYIVDEQLLENTIMEREHFERKMHLNVYFQMHLNVDINVDAALNDTFALLRHLFIQVKNPR